MSDQVNKYRIHAATGYICSSTWAAVVALSTGTATTNLAIGGCLGWFVYGLVCSYVADRQEGNQ